MPLLFLIITALPQVSVNVISLYEIPDVFSILNKEPLFVTYVILSIPSMLSVYKYSIPVSVSTYHSPGESSSSKTLTNLQFPPSAAPRIRSYRSVYSPVSALYSSRFMESSAYSRLKHPYIHTSFILLQFFALSSSRLRTGRPL